MNRDLTVLVRDADFLSGSLTGWYGYLATAEMTDLPSTLIPSRSHPRLSFFTTGRLSK